MRSRTTVEFKPILQKFVSLWNDNCSDLSDVTTNAYSHYWVSACCWQWCGQQRVMDDMTDPQILPSGTGESCQLLSYLFAVGLPSTERQPCLASAFTATSLSQATALSLAECSCTAEAPECFGCRGRVCPARARAPASRRHCMLQKAIIEEKPSRHGGYAFHNRHQ